MSQSQRVAKLQELIEPTVDGLGFELWGLEFISQGRHAILRIYIDAEDGVTVDKCEKVSRQVSAILDVEDPIPNEYTLEVSSPGLDRPLFKLDQFGDYLGELINVRLQVAVNNRRKFKGELLEIEGENLTFKVDGEAFTVTYPQIDKANVVPQF